MDCAPVLSSGVIPPEPIPNPPPFNAGRPGAGLVMLEPSAQAASAASEKMARAIRGTFIGSFLWLGDPVKSAAEYAQERPQCASCAGRAVAASLRQGGNRLESERAGWGGARVRPAMTGG